jgi:hypothetical protein
MGISAVTWRCPRCNQDVGGSLGELRFHWKRVHGSNNTTTTTTTTTPTNEAQADAGSV